MSRLSLLFLAALCACTSGGDADGDGVPASGDCDDDDASVGGAVDVYTDADGDGFGDTETLAHVCLEEGLTRTPGDCDDADPATYPGATEDCSEADRDCDGDPVDGAPGAGLWYLDQDGDGYGVSGQFQLSCTALSGYAQASGDCDDADASVSPGEPETPYDGVDNDCDSSTDDEDVDGDGWTAQAVGGEDCDDQNPAINPDATDLVDGSRTDQNCDGVDGTDGDGDGVASIPSGGTDCDDTNAVMYPGAPRVCDDGVPNDCADAGEEDRTCRHHETSLGLEYAEIQLHGAHPGDYLGRSVGGVGDLTGNGFGDFVVVATLEGGGGVYRGRGYLFEGPADSVQSLSDAYGTWTGAADGAAISAVVGAGDFNGDGDPDMVFGPYGYDGGAAQLILGPVASGDHDLIDADLTLMAEGPIDGAGLSLTTLEDLDGDGRDELVVSAYRNDGDATEVGAFYLVHGFQPSAHQVVSLAHADVKVVGEDAYDWMGQTVASVGDVNLDGTPDLLVSAHQNDQTGTDAGLAYVVDGADLAGASGQLAVEDVAMRITGVAAGDRLGWDLAGIGSFDDSGYPSFVIMASEGDLGGTTSGQAYVFHGDTSFLRSVWSLRADDADMIVRGEGSNSYLSSVAEVGDVNGDGFDELFVGGLEDRRRGSDAGAAYLFYGQASWTGTYDADDGEFFVVGEGAGDWAKEVGGAGDVNGDGKADLLVGAYKADGGDQSGAAYLIFGSGI
ncbi:MAG: FG-GAP repeat protein [Alphaproteobacteria bacterium]|nr:FG-GAP repeat protein [Alphaproteobacteria bacterium]MCB9794459.1 FG-GAP repeat protein [Alphaproteobacteria bacterium]